MISKAERKLIYPLALLVSTAKRKTCEAIALATGKSGDALLRLLNEGLTIMEDLIAIAKKFFIGKILYLIIDDTIISKIHSKIIEGTSDNYDSSSRNSYRSLCSVTAMISDGNIAIPISQKIWTAEEFTGDTYKKKSELSQELITIIRSHLDVKMFLADGIYATQEMMRWLIASSFSFEMRFHSNRVIDYHGNKIAIRDLP
jgi:DDE superfamily endonuclease